MTREYEIRKEALKWKADDNEFIAQTAFEAGALWADRNPKSQWKNTKDELPRVVSCNYAKVNDAIHDSDIEDTCLCHFENGLGLHSSEYFIGHLESEYIDNSRDNLYWADDTGDIICRVDEVDFYMIITNPYS